MVGIAILLLSSCLAMITVTTAVSTNQFKPIIAGLLTKCEHRKGTQNAMGMLISERMKVFQKTILRRIYNYLEFDICQKDQLHQTLISILLNSSFYINGSADSFIVKHFVVYMPEHMLKNMLYIISFTNIHIWPLQDPKERGLTSGKKEFDRMHLIHKRLPITVIAKLMELLNLENVHIVDVVLPGKLPLLSLTRLRERIPNKCFSYNEISSEDIHKAKSEPIYAQLKAEKTIAVIFVLGQMAAKFKQHAYRKGVHANWVVFSKYKSNKNSKFLSILNSESVIHNYFVPFSNKTVCHPSFVAYQESKRQTLLCAEPPNVTTSPELSLNKDRDKYEYIRTNMLPTRCIDVRKFHDKEDYQKLEFFQYPNNANKNIFHSFNLIDRTYFNPKTDEASKCSKYDMSENYCIERTIREVKSNVFGKQYKYSCKTCQSDHFIDEYGKCYKCVERTRPNSNKTKCYDPVLPFKPYLSCYIMSGLALLVTTFTMIVYIVFRKTPVVKCSNFDLSIIQLSACNLLQIGFFVFMKEPTVSICTLRPIIVSTLLVIIVSIVVGKAEKILIIFFTKTRLTKRDIKEIWVRQIVVFSFLLAVNFILIPAVIKLPATVEEVRHFQNEEGDWFIFLNCSTDKQSITLLMYSMVIVILAIIQGYRGRKLPANYNEGTSISIAAACLLLALTFCIWAMNANNTIYQKVYIVWMSLSVGLILFIVCLYGLKIFVILFQATKNTRTYQMNLMLADALKKAEKDMLMPNRKRSGNRLHIHDLSFPSKQHHENVMTTSQEPLPRFRARTLKDLKKCE